MKSEPDFAKNLYVTTLCIYFNIMTYFGSFWKQACYKLILKDTQSASLLPEFFFPIKYKSGKNYLMVCSPFGKPISLGPRQW